VSRDRPDEIMTCLEFGNELTPWTPLGPHPRADRVRDAPGDDRARSGVADGGPGRRRQCARIDAIREVVASEPVEAVGD